MRKKSKASPILGFSDTETVKLDFDETSFSLVRYWALRTMKWFKLKGFLILKSSEKCYHIVFDQAVSWSENMHIVAWVALHSHNRGLLRWFLMQCIKEGSTLRVSTKKQKPSPRIALRHGKQEDQIRHFLAYRKLVKNITRKLNVNLGKSNR